MRSFRKVFKSIPSIPRPKFNLKTPRFKKKIRGIRPEFKNLKSKVFGRNKISKFLNKHPALIKTLGKSVSLKKAAIMAAGGTFAAYLSRWVSDYIEENSGCFLKSGDATCKVLEMSCCSSKISEEVPACEGAVLEAHPPCQGYNEDADPECCKKCSCEHFGCTGDQSVTCQVPTVGEALSAFVEASKKGLFGFAWSSFLSWLPWIAGLFVFFCVVMRLLRGR